MNKYITIKEILRRIINDEILPKEIIFGGYKYEYNDELKLYLNKTTNTSLGYDCTLDKCLDNVATILDEQNDEFEDIEETNLGLTTNEQNEEAVRYFVNGLNIKMNKLIRNQNKIISKIERLNKDE